MLKYLMRHNVIAKRELEYARAQQYLRRWHYLLLLPGLFIFLPYVLTLFPGLTLLGTSQGFPFLPYPTPGFGYAEIAILLAMVTSAYLFPAFLVFQITAVATNALSREIEGGSWQALILSEVSAAQIVWGKWWAVVRYFARDFLIASILPTLLTYVLMTSIYLFLLGIDSLISLYHPLWGMFRPYCSRQIFGGFEAIGPQLQMLLLDNLALALAISVVFSLTVLALSVSASQLIALIARRASLASVGLVWGARLVMVLALIAGFAGLAAWKQTTQIT